MSDRWCESCEVVMVNGVCCHEHGCPDSWKRSRRDCKSCGSTFTPESRGQVFCDDMCAGAHNCWDDR